MNNTKTKTVRFMIIVLTSIIIFLTLLMLEKPNITAGGERSSVKNNIVITTDIIITDITTTDITTNIKPKIKETEIITTTSINKNKIKTSCSSKLITTTNIATINKTFNNIVTTTVKKEEREFVVFKPSTYYIHKNTCRWVNDECYEINDTKDIVSRKCSECNPEMNILNEYIVEETPMVNLGIDSYSRQLLAEIVWHEAGSNWISQYEKARVCAGVMNRVNDSRFPNTVYDVLTQPGQFSGYWPGCCIPTQECYDAVDYYFSNKQNFGNENSWFGDGYKNTFYYQ